MQHTSEKQLKHFEQTLATYVYSHCNICNIHMKQCNMRMKHLKHTLATCAFSATSSCCLAESRLVDAELDAHTKLDATEVASAELNCARTSVGEWRAATAGDAVEAVNPCHFLVLHHHRYLLVSVA